MFTLAMISQKGGSGRSTLAVNLAGEAAKSGKVLVIDLDPQGSASIWGRLRGDDPPDVSPGHPATLEQDVAAARSEGYDWCVIDTSPHADRVSVQAARLADLVVAPVKPAMFDLAAVNATLDLCALAKRPAVIVINHAPIRSKVVQEAGDDIRARGGEVCPVVIHQRVALSHCLIAGQTADEYDPGCAAGVEITNLLAYLSTRRLR